MSAPPTGTLCILMPAPLQREQAGLLLLELQTAQKMRHLLAMTVPHTWMIYITLQHIFWSQVGYSSISDCVAYGDTAPGMDDTTPVFRGDTSYYGWI